jgi:hypothetical protein
MVSVSTIWVGARLEKLWGVSLPAVVAGAVPPTVPVTRADCGATGFVPGWKFVIGRER